MAENSPHNDMQHTVQISRENETLLTSLHTFYGFPSSDQISNNMKIILPYLNGTANIAIRYIDWFVTNYAKKHHVTYEKTNPGSSSPEIYDVYSGYRGLLKGYTKQIFDPFCREGNDNEKKEIIKIPFKYAKDKFVLTTFGQLNFYKWAIQNGVLEYIEKNYEKIKLDLEETNKKRTTEEKSQSSTLTKSLTSSTEKKRKELSENSYKSMHVNKLKSSIKLEI